MSSTLAGNFTLLGSVANLIVAEQARAEGTPISFWAHFKVGLPRTVVTLAAGNGLAGMDVAIQPAGSHPMFTRVADMFGYLRNAQKDRSQP